MHGAALTTLTARLTSSQLSEYFHWIDTHQIAPTMATVCRNKMVRWTHCRVYAFSERWSHNSFINSEATYTYWPTHTNSFLSGIEVTKTAHDFFRIHTIRNSFQTSYGRHLCIYAFCLLLIYCYGFRWKCFQTYTFESLKYYKQWE